ncbi:MAG TPA: dynamin family protein [Acidimicrobiales bacterium]|nr:dynamin family protein [Acidimicrobiales bacterium]
MTTTTSALTARVRRLLDDASLAVADNPRLGAAVRAATARMDEPLRVAIAGKVKAGKSTLLNALVGEQLAPTDASECTRIVTWYRNGLTYRVFAVPAGQEPRQARFTRDGGALNVVLDDLHLDPDDVERLEVEWPSAALREFTLIDTPGIASLTQATSDRAVEFLAPSDDTPTAADAVIYLLRHIHPSDRKLLEAFRDDDLAQPTPVNSIGVLSRADEIGSARIDALTSARAIAERYKRDSSLRRLCQTVVPVAGLVAQGGATLQQGEFNALGQLTQMPPADLDKRLLTVDRFIADDPSVPVVAGLREQLLERFGLFGVRLGVALIRQGVAANAGALAHELVRRSGLDELRAVLRAQFADRAHVLKARSALLEVEAVLRDPTAGRTDDLLANVESIRASAHEFAELRLLNQCRAGQIDLREAEMTEAERLLGTEGTTVHERLGLPLDASAQSVRSAVLDSVTRWRRRAESPLSSRPVANAAEVLARTGEGLLSSLDGT